MTVKYPYQYHPQNGVFSGAWHSDYSAADPTFIAASMASTQGYSPLQSGWSGDGGYSWTRFKTLPLNSTHGVTMFGEGSIHVGSPNNIVWISSYSHGAYRTTDRGDTWTALVVPGVDVTTLNTQAHYFYRRPCASEKTAASADTFYLHANNVGFLKSTDAAATWTQVCNNTPFATSNWNQNAYLKAVPDHPGHLFFTPGIQGTFPYITTTPFLRSTDGGAAWSQVATIRAVRGFDFGKEILGGTYPSIYAVGAVAGVNGLYRSTDNAVTWDLLTTQPNGTVDMIRHVAASKDIYGLGWITTQGSGLIRFEIT